MVTLFFISISIFIVYMSISMLFFGIPKSISDTYYHWEDKGVDLEILFTSFIWGITFPLMVLWIEILPDDWNFIPFIASVSLLFVGTATAFKLPLTREVHSISAFIAGLASYTWSFAYGSHYIVLITLALSLIGVFANKKNWLFWLELGLFLNMYVQLAILL